MNQPTNLFLEVRSTLGELAAASPDAARVFERFGLDYCCGGRRTVAEACAAAGVDPADVAAALARGGDQSDQQVWRDRPLGELIDHLLARYHAPLRAELERLGALAERVHHAHAAHAGEQLTSLASLIWRLTDELLPHMQKEEQVLFPWIRSGRGYTAQGPVAVMQREHEEVAELLVQIRQVASDFVPPPSACASWRALYGGLAQLEHELHAHIHLENNVLFPGALAAPDAGLR